MRPPRWHYAAIAALPLLLTLININWAFANLGTVDAWYYFGDFIHFPRIQLVYGNYPSERILWILPGYYLVHWFGAVAGVLLLHLLTLGACLFLLHSILLRVADYRTAFFGAIMLGCNAHFIGANGWDYPEGAYMTLFLCSAALLVPRRGSEGISDLAVFLSAAVWAGLLSLYIAWAALTPAYLYVLFRGLPRPLRWQSVARSLAMGAAGGILSMMFQWAAYLAMGGHGFYLTNSFQVARILAGAGLMFDMNKDWYREPVWLIFPAFGIVAAGAGLLRAGGRSRDMLWFYLVTMALMVAVSFGSWRLLTFEFKTSVVLPALFLALALVIFRVPDEISGGRFYLITGVAAAICLAPLGRAGLYLLAWHWWFLYPVFFVLTVVMVLRIRGRLPEVHAFAACAVLFACASFGIVPIGYGRIWQRPYDGPAVTRRIARATRVVIDRLPAGRFPAFWYQNESDRLSEEFRGIMCSLITINESMMDFPRLVHSRAQTDLKMQYKAGARIFLLSERQEGIEAASYQIASAGMPVAVRSRDRISGDGESYWIVQLEVMPFTEAGLLEGFAVADRVEQRGAFPGNPTVVLHRAGIYQFELRHAKSSGPVKFGALGEAGEWLEESGLAIAEGDEEISWFRMGVRPGKPVRLAVTGISSGALSVLRATEAADLRAFDMQRGKVRGGNLLAKSNFDDGTNDWTAMKGSLRPVAGFQSPGAVEFTPSGRDSQYLVWWNAVGLQTGQAYELTAWIRSMSGKPLRVECGMWDVARQRWTGRQAFTATQEWTQATVRFRSDTAAKVSPIFWQSLGDFGAMQVDEVELRPVARGIADTSSIPNGGFEDGLAGWDAPQGKIAPGDDCYRGACAEFTPLGTAMQYLVSWSSVAPVKGRSYEMTAWIRSASGKPLHLQCGIWEQKGNRFAAYRNVVATGEWQQITIPFRSDSNEKLSPIFWESLNEYGPLQVDEVTVR
ncbi:MAG: hypothetical protein ABI806_20030 [Candidatus Solibacter sp.]